MTDLPPIQDIQRLTLGPNDRLVVKVKATSLSRDEFRRVKQAVLQQLQLPDEFPLLITNDQLDISVLEHSP